MNKVEEELIVDIIEKQNDINEITEEILRKKRTELLTIKLVLMMKFIISGALLFWNGLQQEFAIGYAMFIASCAFLLFSNEV